MSEARRLEGPIAVGGLYLWTEAGKDTDVQVESIDGDKIRLTNGWCVTEDWFRSHASEESYAD